MSIVYTYIDFNVFPDYNTSGNIIVPWDVITTPSNSPICSFFECVGFVLSYLGAVEVQVHTLCPKTFDVGLSLQKLQIRNIDSQRLVRYEYSTMRSPWIADYANYIVDWLCYFQLVQTQVLLKFYLNNTVKNKPDSKSYKQSHRNVHHERQAKNHAEYVIIIT